MTAAPRPPAGLGPRGRRLWRDITGEHQLDAMQRVLLEEACRAASRLDILDQLLRGEVDVWATLVHDLRTEDYELKIDGAMAEARQQQNILKQLLASLRLPDEASGKRPQQRGAARGAYGQRGAPASGAPAGAPSGTVSSLDRARAAREGA